MQTPRKKKTNPKQTPKVRNLKVNYKCRPAFLRSKIVPTINLSGNWLEKLGFCHGEMVTVTTSKNLLVIRLVK